MIEVPVETTFPLRERLLRHDRTDLALHMPDDDTPGAFHLAVTDDTRAVVGVASVMPAEPEFAAAQPAWRLRQMAVAAAQQGTGIGAALFDEAVVQVRRRDGATLWAESRTTSLGFYLARGMVVVPNREHSVAGVDYVDVALSLMGLSQKR